MPDQKLKPLTDKQIDKVEEMISPMTVIFRDGYTETKIQLKRVTEELRLTRDLLNSCHYSQEHDDIHAEIGEYLGGIENGK